MDQLIESATTSMEVGWYQKMSGVKHTGIVVLINGEPRFSIDFEGNVNVHEWKDKDRRIREKFIHVSFELEIMQKLQPNQHTTQFARNAKAKHFMSIVVISKANKDRAKNILKDIQEIKMGEYNAMGNNCRSHVVNVYYMMINNWRVDSNSFLNEIKQILAEDVKKIVDGVDTVGVLGSVVLSLAVVCLLPASLPFLLPVAIPLAGTAGYVAFSEAGVGVVHAVSKSSKSFGKKIQSCVVSNSTSNASPQGSSLNAEINNFPCSFGYNASLLELKDNGVFKGSVWNRRYSTYFQQVHGSSCRDGYDGYDYDDDMTHFFIIPPNIEIDDENVKEILHDMLMMGMAPSITSVSDNYIDEVYWKVIIGCRYCQVLRHLFQDFGRQLTSECKVLVFKTTDLIHSEDYTSEAEIIPFNY